MIETMIESRDNHAETTIVGSDSPFEEVLTDLRVSGSVVLHDAYAPPWTIDVPEESALRAALNVGRNVRLMPFHLVLRGGFEMEMPDGQVFTFSTKDVAICPGGGRHQMRVGRTEPVSLIDILSGVKRNGRGFDGEGDTELICGVFMLRANPLNPMLEALPAVLKVAIGDSDRNPMLSRTAEMLEWEVRRRHRQSSFTADRLIEIFCGELLRASRNDVALAGAGWFRGLVDSKISKALALIHSNPAAPWSVPKLANAAALSPSRFAARFRDLTGETAMGYLTRWRMALACRYLEDPDETVESVAARVGYAASVAFSRAFKARLGIAPTEWRKHLRTE